MTNDRREFLRLAGLAVAAAALDACNSDGPKSAQKLLAFAERKNVGVEELLFRHTSMDRAKESAREWRARLTPEQRADLRRWRKEHRWSPNRLRHSRATELRPYGLDVAKTVLGHSKVETTEVYAEKDLAAAMELMGRIG